MPAIQRVLLLADTHGHLDERVATIAPGCDWIVHAGDIGGAGILERLGVAGAGVVAIVGNNDDAAHWPAADLPLLATLPEQASIELPGGRLDVVHGHRQPARDRHRRLRARHSDAAAVVVGHSHRRAIDRDGLPWILNPGAAGRSRAYGGPGCLVLTAAGDGWVIEAHAFAPQRR